MTLMKAGGVHVCRLPPDPSRLKHENKGKKHMYKLAHNTEVTREEKACVAYRFGNRVRRNDNIVYSTSRSAMFTWLELTGSEETNEHKCHRSI